MVTDGDDQRFEGSRGEKGCPDLLPLLGSYGEEKTRSVRGKEDDDSVSTEFSLGIRTTDECNNQQNPDNYSHDNASSSWSLSSVVYQEPIRAEPLREVKPPVRRKKPVERETGATPEWLVNLMRRLRGVNVKLVIDKMIQTTDVNANQGRLLIPFNQIIEMDFLNEAELNIIDDYQRDNNNIGGVDVIVVASDGRKWDAKLRRWNMTCPDYALCSGWNDVVRGAELENKVGQIFSLWSFHSQDETKLYLAFLHQPPARELSLCELALRRLPKIPTRSRTRLVCVPSPPRVSEDFNLNQPLVQEMAPLEAEQERHDRRTSLESVTETTSVVLVRNLLAKSSAM
ncbi:hypothetical protein N665_0207s0005 [Sinapis alba]|nr:hypothetical protein N665_0207s0005 [Sinapis alba]